MADRYFENFPKITYANNVAVNIMERVAVLSSITKNPNVFYPYQVSEGERPDNFSDRYYNDQYKSWLLYLTNNIIDPYHQWYLPENEFNGFLVAKYNQDVSTLQSKTYNFINNWFTDERKISIAQYNTLANTEHKFWTPYYDLTNTIQGYKRSEDDTTINTNQILTYSTDGNNYTTNEVVNIIFDTNNKGYGQVVASNSSSLTLQHVFGVTEPSIEVPITGSSYLYGRESHSNNVFTDVSVVTTNISLNEAVYFSPVSIYEYEKMKNEQSKLINVLNSNYAHQAVNELKKILK